ncbi:MAG TPA: recombinase family protein [Streptosporangiaceae bacterium]|nr:recombinase family protein [Streptosporangiaceae bacterium]
MRRCPGGPARGCPRFAFYGRVSTEDWQDPVTSRARQREQAGALVRGHGQVVAEFFDAGQSRTVAWGRRPQAAALVAAMADPGRDWDAVVIGEYERAFYGSQYALMAPLFEHYGVQLWMPEAGGRVDYASEHDEHAMTVLGLSSKREVTRTSIRVRTAMAVQVREQGRYLGGRPPYGYRLGDGGPHPNKAHAAWGRRAHRLEPDPETAHVVRWIFAQRLAGHSVARIVRALNEAGIPCPSAVDPGRNPHRTGRSWTLGTVTTILSNPRYTGHQVWNRQRTDNELADPADVSLGHKEVQRWNLPDGWVISKRPAHEALVSEADFISAQDVHAARGPSPEGDLAGPAKRRYLLSGLLVCGTCGRRMESAWSNGKPAYRCRHGHTTSSAPSSERAKNAYVREDRIVPHLPALHLLLTEPAGGQRRRRTRRGTDVRYQAVEDVICYLRGQQLILTYDPAIGVLRTGTGDAAQTITLKAS